MLKPFLGELNSNKIRHDETLKLSDLSYSQTGSSASTIVFPKNESELIATIKLANENGLKYMTFGGMTNVVFSSHPLDVVLISMLDFDHSVEYDSKTNIVKVGSGQTMKGLAQWGLIHSINGFQWMEGIPGTIGAGVFMNAGFLPGQDMQSYLVETRVLMPDLTIQIFKNKDMNYSYRKSELQVNGGIVLSTKFLVRRGKKWKIQIRMFQYHQRRKNHQPLEFPSAGTVFIQPVPYHTGGLLSQLHMKGYRVGGAEISELSPGFIIGRDHMTGEDYLKLAHKIQSVIKQKYGISLEMEVRLVGFTDGELNEG